MPHRHIRGGRCFADALIGADMNGDGDADDAGEFGDGQLNNLDLIQALRRVVNLDT